MARIKAVSRDVRGEGDSQFDEMNSYLDIVCHFHQFEINFKLLKIASYNIVDIQSRRIKFIIVRPMSCDRVLYKN